jgi:hypothetical protein
MFHWERPNQLLTSSMSERWKSTLVEATREALRYQAMVPPAGVSVKVKT